MWDTTLMTHIDIQLADQSLKEMHNMVRILEGSQTEYEGR